MRSRARPIQVYLDEREEETLHSLMQQHGLSKSDTVRYSLGLSEEEGALRMVEENEELRRQIQHLKDLNEEQRMVIEEMDNRVPTQASPTKPSLKELIEQGRRELGGEQ